MDKLRAISYFIEAAESGSFSSAARRFNVPASSVSRRIADLEQSLGAQLLTRTTRSISLTEVGKQYLEQVKSVLAQVELSEQLVHNYQSKPTGRLKISTMVGFGQRILLPILDEFSQRYPEITLDVVFNDALSKLDKDDVDIAIRGGYAPDERVVAIRLMDNNFVAAASPAYLERAGHPKTTEELRLHPGLYFKTPVGPTPWLSEVNGQWQDVSGPEKLVSNNGSWLLERALKGDGIILLPRWALEPNLSNGDLIELSFEQPLQVTQQTGLAVYMLYQKLDYTNPKIKAAVDFIAARVKQEASSV